MIPGTHAVVTERTGFMARLPPAGAILQATAAGGQANQMFPKARYHSTTSDGQLRRNPVREGLPTNWTELSQSHPSFGLFNLRRLHQSCYCPRTGWRQVLSAGVTTTDVNRNSDSRNQCDTRRLAKCAIVSVPTHKAILPCVCLRSLTTRAGCGEPCTYKRALSPCTSIFSLVHSPGTTSV